MASLRSGRLGAADQFSGVLDGQQAIAVRPAAPIMLILIFIFFRYFSFQLFLILFALLLESELTESSNKN